jgi:nucleotide-binding universal stress UspA family protein
MIRFLLPIDGSEVSDRAVEKLIRKLDWYRERPEIHLLNVQPPLHHDVGMFVAHDELQKFHHDRGTEALASARAKLDAAGVPYIHHIGVGEPVASVIAHYSREKQIDQIVMGTRGHGGLAGMLLGDVARKVIHLTEVPVLLVK